MSESKKVKTKVGYVAIIRKVVKAIPNKRTPYGTPTYQLDGARIHENR